MMSERIMMLVFLAVIFILTGILAAVAFDALFLTGIFACIVALASFAVGLKLYGGDRIVICAMAAVLLTAVVLVLRLAVLA